MKLLIRFSNRLIFLTIVLIASSFAQDTTGGIAWGPLMQFTPDTVLDGFSPTIVVQGDTVHIVWDDFTLLPYVRSTDGGNTFESIRKLAPDSVKMVGSSWIFPAGKRLLIFFRSSSTPTHGEFLYFMYSDDGGTSWTVPRQLAEEGAMPFSAAASGDTIAFLNPAQGGPYKFQIIVSSDAGKHWIKQPFTFMSDVTGTRIAFAGGALHLVSSWSFDSSITSPGAAIYRRSTDLGATWSDSVKMSSDDSPEASGANITVYPNGDSSRVFVAWRDAKYGCLTDVGCSILGRLSNDNGRSFGPEVHFDQRPSGYRPISSMQDTIMAMTWQDDIPYTVGPTVVMVSSDRGTHWTTPYPVLDTTAICAVAVSCNTIHMAFERLVGGVIWGHWRIFYRRGTILPVRSTFAVTMQEDWNLISLPLDVPGSRRSALFPFSASYAYSYHGGYTEQETLSAGNGYWLKFDEYYRRITYYGEPVSRVTLDLAKGWNLIGAPSSPVGLGNISTVPPGIVTSFVYGYTDGYSIADTLYPSQGYWIKLAQDGRLAIESSAAAGNIAKHPEVEQLNYLIVRDAAGKSQTLYFGSYGSDGMWELPPPPPVGVFDCRFASGTMAAFVQGTSVLEAPVLISSARLPVTIAWDMKGGSLPAELLIGGYAVPLAGGGSTQLYDGKSSVILRLNAGREAPKEFALHQNYPNPFNPVTRICFSLPAAGMASMVIYDVFGREVTTLVNGRMEGGEHSAEWSGGNYASGVYFCRLSWHDPRQGIRSAVSKMLMVK
jgi:hypothetical protein